MFTTPARLTAGRTPAGSSRELLQSRPWKSFRNVFHPRRGSERYFNSRGPRRTGAVFRCYRHESIATSALYFFSGAMPCRCTVESLTSRPIRLVDIARTQNQSLRFPILSATKLFN